MDTLWQILIQFIFRVTFGVAFSMLVTPARLVTSGFYRVHLWVLLGLNTFAALILFSARDNLDQLQLDWRFVGGVALSLCLLSYVGSVIWLYERSHAGGIALFVIALLAFIAAILATPTNGQMTGRGALLAVADLVTSGLLLGTTLSAMFLGHWYLNTPTMELVPLKRLVALMIGSILVRSVLCATGVWLFTQSSSPQATAFWLFILFRWLSGLLGTLTMAWMAWLTLKVPNTQSATGILYAGVIFAFLGELTSQILSVERFYPL